MSLLWRIGTKELVSVIIGNDGCSSFDFFVDGIPRLVEILQVLLHLHIGRLESGLGWLDVLLGGHWHPLNW